MIIYINNVKFDNHNRFEFVERIKGIEEELELMLRI